MLKSCTFASYSNIVTMIKDSDYKLLRDVFLRRLSATKTKFRRYLHSNIHWDARLIGIKGCRGVGKTTLILQYIKQHFSNYDAVLYVSLDDIWFESHSIQELIEYCYPRGVRYLFFDEVHRLPHWQTVMKNLYDNYPDMKIVYTGSCMLELDAREGDLSRRQLMYTMQGLSFREFIELSEGIALPPIDLQDLLVRHNEVSMDIAQQLPIIASFEKYLMYGYYPFFVSDKDGFDLRLRSVIRQVLESDLPAVENISFETVRKVSKMLSVLAQRVPQTPRMQELYAQLNTSREQGLKMLYLLDRSGLLALLSQEAKSFKHLPKPDKIYLGDCNLMYAVSSKVDVGTIRETFFYNQLRAQHDVVLPPNGDFLVDGRYLFEVGGPSKDFSQIKDLPNSYLAIDGVEYGMGHRIPLWMFGFLY